MRKYGKVTSRALPETPRIEVLLYRVRAADFRARYELIDMEWRLMKNRHWAGNLAWKIITR